MTKSELLAKWQEEIEYSNAKAVNSETATVRAWFSSRFDTISEMIEDIKNLNGETVKLREESLLDEDDISALIKIGQNLFDSEI